MNETQIGRRFYFTQLLLSGHVRLSKLTWDRSLSFCRLNHLNCAPYICPLNFSNTAVKCRMVVLAELKTEPLNILKKALYRTLAME